MDQLQSFDLELFRLLNTSLANPIMDQAMLLVTSRLTWLIAGLIAVGVALVTRRRRLLVFCVGLALTLGVVDLVTFQVLKPTFARPRPCYELEGVRLIQERCGSDFGFPSNHAANGMMTAVLVALTFKRRAGVWAIPLAVVVGFSRIYLGVHYPTDVLVGFLLGGLAAWPAYRILRRWLPDIAQVP